MTRAIDSCFSVLGIRGSLGEWGFGLEGEGKGGVKKGYGSNPKKCILYHWSESPLYEISPSRHKLSKYTYLPYIPSYNLLPSHPDSPTTSSKRRQTSIDKSALSIDSLPTYLAI